MNVRHDFFKGTGWESDYTSGRRVDAAISGYRGPFPTDGNELNTVETMLGSLFATSSSSQLSNLVGLIAGADRLMIAWRAEGAVGVLAARSVEADGLTGWHLSVIAIDPRFRGRKLLPELVRVLVSEEPVDFVSVITNEELVYRALAWASPGRAVHPDRSGRYGVRIRSIADAVLGQLPGASALPALGADFTWRSLLGQQGETAPGEDAESEPPEAADGKSRFRASLRLGPGDAAFVVGDVSGVVGAAERAKRGLMAVSVGRRAQNVAVTGTNGKTSCVEFGRQLSRSGGHRTASFGTLGVVTDRGRTRSPCIGTGPRALPELADRLWTLGHDVVWSEAFSYSLSRAQFDHLPVDVAAFTQFGLDHLGMHQSPAAYWAAKERLFEAVLLPLGTLVIDPSAEGASRIMAIAGRRKLKVITTGAGNSVEIGAGRLRVDGRTFGCEIPITEPVMVKNLELAVAANLALGLTPDELATGIELLCGPPGRFEELELSTPFRVVIDSAHNADALEASLGEWRGRTAGRLLVVVASVGSADEGRWEPIGEVADVLADVVVVTDESPYEGDAKRIRDAIRRGCPRSVEIADRRAAIDFVVANAVEGDTVVVTGRADEDFLIAEHGSVPYPTDAELLAGAVSRLNGAPLLAHGLE